MLTVEQALQAILEHVGPSTTAEIPLAESLHRVLREDLTTPHDSPPFDKSMMDGFAVKSEGFDAGQNVLSVRETITAGTVPTVEVEYQTASRIMTGAPIPEGADCVVPIERVQFSDDNPSEVSITSGDVAPEKNILRKGFAAKTGEPLMQEGTVLEPQHIAVLAEFGVAKVPASRQPTVAVLATGDELLDIDQPLVPGRIRNSNEPMLAAQIERAHATAVPLGVAKDNRDELSQKIQEGLKCDFLLLSGGVSAGTLDLVPSELSAADVQQVFHKIQMKPGKPLWFGRFNSSSQNCLVFGLPGNPVSSMVCFELFVRTAIRAFSGCAVIEPRYVEASLTDSVSVKGDRPTYIPCQLLVTNDGLLAIPVPWGGSADLRSTAEANGMCRLEPQAEPYANGARIPVISWQ